MIKWLKSLFPSKKKKALKERVPKHVISVGYDTPKLYVTEHFYLTQEEMVKGFDLLHRPIYDKVLVTVDKETQLEGYDYVVMEGIVCFRGADR